MNKLSKVPERIETERLVLRKPVLTDAAPLFCAYANDPKIPHFMSWRAHTDVSQTTAFLTNVLREWEQGTSVEFVIALVGEPDNPVGMIGMHDIYGSGRGFGYVIARPYWGKGYMTEALTKLAGWALSQPDVWRVQVFCDTENIASQRVAEKSGLRLEGTLAKYFVHPNISTEPRDSLMYARVC